MKFVVLLLSRDKKKIPIIFSFFFALFFLLLNQSKKENSREKKGARRREKKIREWKQNFLIIPLSQKEINYIFSSSYSWSSFAFAKLLSVCGVRERSLMIWFIFFYEMEKKICYQFRTFVWISIGEESISFCL